MIVKADNKEYEIKEEDIEFYNDLCKELDDNKPKVPSSKELSHAFTMDVIWLFIWFALLIVSSEYKNNFFILIMSIATIISFFKTLSSLITISTPRKVLEKRNEISDSKYLKNFINKRVRFYTTADGLDIEENLGFFEHNVVGRFGGDRIEDVLWKVYKAGGNAIINFNHVKRDTEPDTISGDIVRVKNKKQISLN